MLSLSLQGTVKKGTIGALDNYWRSGCWRDDSKRTRDGGWDMGG